MNNDSEQQLYNRKSIQLMLESLKRSKFRARFILREKERKYIHDKGISTIRKHAVDFITSRIAPENPENDGRQTPMTNHPVFIAQHATATCCRGCMEKWHNISKGQKLSDTQIVYSVDLIMAWIEQQIQTTKRAIQ